MSNAFWTTLTFVLALSISAGSPANADVYEGDYFAITYPESFTAIEINGDEASFFSPDDTVEFYVHAPQWSGQPETYLDVKGFEELVDEKSVKSNKEGVYLDHVQVKFATIRARDGAYWRSYMQRRQCHTNAFIDCVSYVFGIKYRDDQALSRHREAYKAYKASLEQFSD